MNDAVPPGRASAVNAVPREGRPFQGLRAGVVSRVLANTVDFLVVLGVLVGCWIGWAAVLLMWRKSQFEVPIPSLGLAIVAGGWLMFLYFTVSWATTGRSYGDHLLGLRVVNLRGRRLRPTGAVLRAGFCVLFPIGLFWCVVSRENRSLQDVALRTSVVYDWQTGPEPA